MRFPGVSQNPFIHERFLMYDFRGQGNWPVDRVGTLQTVRYQGAPMGKEKPSESKSVILGDRNGMAVL